jgi:hypothetical protein
VSGVWMFIWFKGRTCQYFFNFAFLISLF